MTDNVAFQNQSFGTLPVNTVFATDNIGGVNYERVKVVWGADGFANDASSSAPLPVDLANTGSNVNPLNVAQSGPWTINQGGVWNVTNITGTVSLPTGAATAAKQPALGTAGTPSVDVLSVQGVTSMTPLKVDGSGVTQPVSYAQTGHGTATGSLRVELPTDGTGVIAAVGGITNALPAGTNTIGKTYGAPQTAKALTQASISISSSGDNTVVAGTASQTIRVFRLVLVAASAVNVTIKNGTAGTALTGAIPLKANGSISVDVPLEGEPAFVSASGGNMVVNLSSGVTVTGWIDYTKS